MRALLIVTALLVTAGCNKEEKKAEPAAPDQAPATQAAAQGAAPQAQVQAQAGGAQVLKPGTGTPQVLHNSASGNTLKLQNGQAEGTTADGRKIVVQGNNAVVEDPSRPGAKVQIQGDKVVVPGVGAVPVPK